MLPKSIVPKLYDPTFMPAKLDLAEFVSIQDADETNQVQESVSELMRTSPLVKLLTSGDVPKPLSYEEALAIDIEISSVQQAIAQTRTRILKMLNAVDEIGQGSSNGKGEISYKLDISKRAHLRKAIKQAFGVKTDTITYSMYKAALEAKKKLEASEASDYVNLKWK